MKFVKRIGDGEITIEDNEVIEKPIVDRADDWAQEFVTHQVPPLSISPQDFLAGLL